MAGYVLRPGDKGLEIVLVKMRFDTLRGKIALASPIGNPIPTWGPSHPESNKYDTILYWNVAAFQTLANRYVVTTVKPIAVDGLYGPATQYCLAVAENWVNDYISRGAKLPRW